MKQVGKTTRPFRYDLNQIPYDYTVEVRNRFKGLDLIECLMNYGQRFVTLYRRQLSRPSPRKEMQKSKMAVWGGLTNSCEKKRSDQIRSVAQSCLTLCYPMNHSTPGLPVHHQLPEFTVHQGCILSPCLFNLYAEYIMRNAGLEEKKRSEKQRRKGKI